ncbi:hypothetical protein BH11MYX4_BH11MYX4_06180 [soil metagenome]
MLGLDAAQLNRTVLAEDGEPMNQLTRLGELGIFDVPVDPTRSARLVPAGEVTAPIEVRARSWLHANCAPCHQPFGPGLGQADLRFGAADPHLCDVAPSAGDRGLTGAKLLVAGAPSRSLIYVRATTRGPGQMPPLGSSLVDPDGAALLRDWIEGMKACP